MPLPRVIDETEIYKDDLIELLSCLRKPERKITLKILCC